MPSGLFFCSSLDRFIFNRRRSCFVLLPYLKEIHVFNANSVDPDQTLRSAASDLSLNCLPISLLWDAGHIWVKQSMSSGIWTFILHCMRYFRPIIVKVATEA